MYQTCTRTSFRHSVRHTLRAAPSKNYAFSTNYHACIAMPTWLRCAPPILCWPWPPYNLLRRLCLTWIFFVDSHWWVPLSLCAAHNNLYMPFRQIIMYILQCPHIYIPDMYIKMNNDLESLSEWFRVNKLSLNIGKTSYRMIYMYTYFVLTSINSCFVHVQQHAPHWIAGAGHPCSDRSLLDMW